MFNLPQTRRVKNVIISAIKDPMGIGSSLTTRHFSFLLNNDGKFGERLRVYMFILVTSIGQYYETTATEQLILDHPR